MTTPADLNLFTDSQAGDPQGAFISNDNMYRYLLWRTETLDAPVTVAMTVLFIMLNPSTADASIDDPTIRKVRGFTRKLGFARSFVVNLYAWRATKPEELRKVPAPIGELNDAFIANAARRASIIIPAWGTNHMKVDGGKRARHVVDMLKANDHKLFHLSELTDGGHPRHPLYLPYDSPLRHWAASSWS